MSSRFGQKVGIASVAAGLGLVSGGGLPGGADPYSQDDHFFSDASVVRALSSESIANQEIEDRFRRLCETYDFNGQFSLWDGSRELNINIIAGNAEVEGANGAGRVDAEPRFNINSVAKQFTALAVLRLCERGELHLDDKVAQFFPNAPQREGKLGVGDVTIRQLLTHTSGLATAYPKGVNPFNRDTLINGILNQPLGGPSGSFKYSNLNYTLAAAIVEKKTGCEFSTVVMKEVFVPAEMSKTAFAGDPALKSANLPSSAAQPDYAHRPPAWSMMGAGGVWSTASDLRQFSVMVEQGRVVSATTLADLWLGESRIGYSYGLEIHKYLDGTLYARHTGADKFGAESVYLRVKGGRRGLVILSNEKIPPALEEQAVAELLGAKPAVLGEALTLNDLPSKGDFKIDTGGTVTIVRNGDSFYCAITGSSIVAQNILCPPMHPRRSDAESLLKFFDNIIPEDGDCNFQALRNCCLYPALGRTLAQEFEERKIGAKAVLPDDLTNAMYFFVETIASGADKPTLLTLICKADPDKTGEFVIEAGGKAERILAKWKAPPTTLAYIRLADGGNGSFVGSSPLEGHPVMGIRWEGSPAEGTLVLEVSRRGSDVAEVGKYRLERP